MAWVYKKTGLFSLGTFLSLLIVYFLYLYSNDQVSAGNAGWKILLLITKWYLIIILGLMGLIVAFFILMMLFFFFMWLWLRIKR